MTSYKPRFSNLKLILLQSRVAGRPNIHFCRLKSTTAFSNAVDISEKTVERSSNQVTVIEFTWSVWVYIDDMTYNSGKYKCVFYKGNDGIQDTGLNFPNNAPGLYINPDTNAMTVMMNTFNVINQMVVIPDVPLNKWFNIIIRCENTTLDVYINGTIARSVNLVGVPKQNYGDVYLGMNGGFAGNISNLWYYNYSLGTAAIQRIAEGGPNTKMIGSTGMNDKMFNYLSLRWFFYGAGDGYNPSGPGMY